MHAILIAASMFALIAVPCVVSMRVESPRDSVSLSQVLDRTGVAEIAALAAATMLTVLAVPFMLLMPKTAADDAY